MRIRTKNPCNWNLNAITMSIGIGFGIKKTGLVEFVPFLLILYTWSAVISEAWMEDTNPILIEANP